jgi:hypothetical protein
MTHVFTMALGPVQDFIAAARRTRDFWFHSEKPSNKSGFPVSLEGNLCGRRISVDASGEVHE